MSYYILLSIPFYTVLCFAPHYYAQSLVSSALGHMPNENPNGSTVMEALREKLGPQELQRWEKAKAAHRNSMEILPVFVGASLTTVFVDVIAARDFDDGVKFVATWLVLRALYIVLYVFTEKEGRGIMRSLIWGLSIGVVFQQYRTCALALSQYSDSTMALVQRS